MKKQKIDPIAEEVHEIREKLYRELKGDMELVASIGQKIAEKLKLKKQKVQPHKLKKMA